MWRHHVYIAISTFYARYFPFLYIYKLSTSIPQVHAYIERNPPRLKLTRLKIVPHIRENKRDEKRELEKELLGINRLVCCTPLKKKGKLNNTRCLCRKWCAKFSRRRRICTFIIRSFVLFFIHGRIIMSDDVQTKEVYTSQHHQHIYIYLQYFHELRCVLP